MSNHESQPWFIACVHCLFPKAYNREHTNYIRPSPTAQPWVPQDPSSLGSILRIEHCIIQYVGIECIAPWLAQLELACHAFLFDFLIDIDICLLCTFTRSSIWYPKLVSAAQEGKTRLILNSTQLWSFFNKIKNSFAGRNANVFLLSDCELYNWATQDTCKPWCGMSCFKILYLSHANNCLGRCWCMFSYTI